jgi:hypothetical protein
MASFLSRGNGRKLITRVPSASFSLPTHACHPSSPMYYHAFFILSLRAMRLSFSAGRSSDISIHKAPLRWRTLVCIQEKIFNGIAGTFHR